jgi:hypothetical protein
VKKATQRVPKWNQRPQMEARTTQGPSKELLAEQHRCLMPKRCPQRMFVPILFAPKSKNNIQQFINMLATHKGQSLKTIFSEVATTWLWAKNTIEFELFKNKVREVRSRTDLYIVNQ